MAKDLIPPPSPAGRPTGEPGQSPKVDPGAKPSLFHPVDEPVIGAEPEPEVPAAAPGPAVPTPYRSRFGFVLGALIGVGLATVALLVGVVANPGGSDVPQNWSTWKPTAKDGFAAAHQIAEHVARKYRMGNGDQLVAVISGPIEFLDVPLSVAVKTAPSGGDIRLLDGKGVMYTLNGLGPQGSIKNGKPTNQRGALVRREALELALYTFRYIDNVDMVVALLPPLPPKKGQTPATLQPKPALFYPPRRPQARARPPDQRDDPARHAAAGDDRAAGGPADRRDHDAEPVRGLLPAGPGRARVPRPVARRLVSGH